MNPGRAAQQSAVLGATVAVTGIIVVAVGAAITPPSELYFTPFGTLVIGTAYRLLLAIAVGLGALLPLRYVRTAPSPWLRHLLTRSVIPGIALAILFETEVLLKPFFFLANALALDNFLWVVLWASVITAALLTLYLRMLRLTMRPAA